MGSLLVDASPLDLCRHNLFLVDRTFRDDLAIRSAYEALAPKFNAISASGRFVTDSVCHPQLAPVGHCMTKLNPSPRRMVPLSKFPFPTLVPADCRWIKNNLCATQRGQSRCLRIPLVPANTDADLAARSVPRLESEIPRREVKLFVIQRIIRNVHFAIFTE